MHQREVAGEALVLQVGVVRHHLVGLELALVHDGAARERVHVEVVHDVRHARAARLLDAHDRQAPEHVQARLQVHLRVQNPRRDEELRHLRLGGQRRLAEVGGGGVRGHVAPAQDVHLHLRARRLDGGHARGAALGVALGQVEHAEAVLAERGQSDLGRGGDEKVVRDGRQDAGAVAGVLLAPARASVRHAHEHLQRLHDVTARGRLVQLAHEPDAARVAVAGGIEKTLRFSRDRFCDFTDGREGFRRKSFPIDRKRRRFGSFGLFRTRETTRVPRGGGERGGSVGRARSAGSGTRFFARDVRGGGGKPGRRARARVCGARAVAPSRALAIGDVIDCYTKKMEWSGDLRGFGDAPAPPARRCAWR